MGKAGRSGSGLWQRVEPASFKKPDGLAASPFLLADYGVCGFIMPLCLCEWRKQQQEEQEEEKPGIGGQEGSAAAKPVSIVKGRRAAGPTIAHTGQPQEKAPGTFINQAPGYVEKKQDPSRNGGKKHAVEPKENTGTDTPEPVGASSITQPLPDKQTLELIIDTLQRKDIYEIFAEPVDPEEVEDYYEIIEEPMDFGTMRAKLHEGMYTSLEQFEHDVFLISGNAMHFNSSGTIFFRQAHAIDKLAKRVFHVLRTNPENFESEFSGTRRRSCRRSQDHETNELNSFSKPCEKSKGGQDGKRCDSVELDRRSTYKPDLDLNNDKYSKSLIHLHQERHSYRESLMHFVKDLGPTAQMVAKRKLQRLTLYDETRIHDFGGRQSQIPFQSHNNNNNGIWFHSSVLNDIGIGKQDSGYSSVLSNQVSSRLIMGGGNESSSSSSSRNGNMRLMAQGGFRRLDDEGFFMKKNMKW
ncbi:hypothetical protein OSB04_024449 [Centaurea solstitialis]|uniref:Bromo domain-containing protein n=1 Tax=Centaurea solstitialis TaxID=347529 RepID=A0AA38W347_9ASTR|nr:hypothetical protein OSB04_024449 [Centaurea solstitialis]